MKMDNFGDRMKMYESRETGRFMPLLPIYVRLDGKGFSKFTKNMKRPYDERMQKCMINTTKYLVQETQAKIGYTQSDEISLVYYSHSMDSQVFFDGKKQKLVSVLASMATAIFNSHVDIQFGDGNGNVNEDIIDDFALFDCRAFQLPNLTEATNAFLWREQDATKNAISMAASHYISHKELQGKSGNEMQEMLWQKHDVNFNDYPPAFKRGTFVRRENYEVPVKDLEFNDEIKQRIFDKGENSVTRTRVEEIYVPKFSTVVNREDVIFNKGVPMTRENSYKTISGRIEEYLDGN